MLVIHTMLPCRCHMLHCTPNECWQVQPRLSTPCWCQFKYSMYTCEDEFILQNNWLSKCATRSIRNGLHAHWLSMLPSFQALHQICDGMQHHKNAMYIRNLLYTSPGDSEEDCWGSSNHQAANLAFLSAHVNLCWSGTGCVSRSLAVHFNIWSQLVTNYSFFSEYFRGFAWFPALVRPNLMVCGAARMHEQHIVVWQYTFVLVPPITSWRLGMEFFRTLYMQTTQWSITETGRWVEGDSLIRAKRNEKQEIWKMWKAKHPYLRSKRQKIKQKDPWRPKYCCHRKKYWSP